MSHLTSEEASAVLGVTIFTSILSFGGSIFIGWTYWRFPNLQNFAFRLVLMIAIADGFRSFANLWGDPSGVPFFCSLQGFLKVFGGVSSFMWVSIIAYVINDVSRHSSEDSGILVVTDLETRFQAIAWGVGLLASILPLFTQSYGSAGAWCFILGGVPKHEAWRWVSYYVILWIAFAYMAFVYIRLYRAFDFDPEILNANATLRRVKYYPLILVVCFLFGTIRRVMNASDFGDVPFAIILLHHLTASIYGFCNAMLYGLTPLVRNTYRQWWMGEDAEAEALEIATGNAESETPASIGKIRKVGPDGKPKYSHAHKDSVSVELGQVAGLRYDPGEDSN